MLTVITACSSPSAKRFNAIPETNSDLYSWVDGELGLYLTTQLSQHPRFKGESVLMVGMNGANVRPDIDTLTQSIRTRIMDRLLSEPGINLVWRPAMHPWQHHRGKTQSVCSNTKQTNYYIGIEITSTPGPEVRVSIRALDLIDQTWVTGFGKTWEGVLTKAQRQAWSQSRVDEYLRGLRILPFTESETDLLAAYLAENLACLLQRQGVDRPLVYLDPGKRTGDVLAKVTSGVSHYLIRQQAIRITNDQGKADLILGGNLNPIDQRLHQLWLTVRPANGAHTMAGIDTDGYILLPGLESNATQRVLSHRPILQVSTRSTPAAPVISELRIKQPRDPQHCDTPGLWADDEAITTINGAIRTEQCVGLEFDLYRDARVYVLNHRIDGELVRLIPTSCRQQQSARSYKTASTTVWIPYQGGGSDQPSQLDGQSRLESFYAIAITQTDSARELEMHLQRLPEDCSDNLLAGPENFELDHWLSRLDILVSRLGDEVDWRGLRVRRER